MRVLARRASAAAAQAAFLLGLLIFVIVAQIGLVSGLAAMGVPGGYGVLVAGAMVLAAVVGSLRIYNRRAQTALAAAEAQRVALGLPDGPCCVIWRGEEEADIPWQLDGDVRAGYPPVAARFGIEGYALVDFEVASDGRPKNLHLVDAWPARVFYDAAADALAGAKFRPRPGQAPRLGASYRMPFVFRIEGSSRQPDRARRAQAKPKTQSRRRFT